MKREPELERIDAGAGVRATLDFLARWKPEIAAGRAVLLLADDRSHIVALPRTRSADRQRL